MYQSYRKTYLDKEIADIERELIAYKSEQSYGIRQIKSRVNTGSAISSWLDNWGWNCVNVKITFVGTNKNKLARGSVVDFVVISDPSMEENYSSSILTIHSSNEAPNVLQWIITSYCAYVPVPMSGDTGDTFRTSSYILTPVVYANMKGSVSYEII